MNGIDNLQLLPGTKKRLGVNVPGENRFLYFGSAILGAVLVSSFAVNQYTASLEKQISNLDGQLLGIEQQRDKETERQLEVVGQQLQLVRKLLDNHPYFSKGFEKIEALLQKDIQFESFSRGAGKDELSIRGLAGSYTVLAKQVAAFLSDDSITDVTLGPMGGNPSGKVDFTMLISFDNKKFFLK